MKSFFESIRDSIYDRLSSPLAMSFIISWILWNYKFLFILFSSLPLPDRLEVASHVNFPNIWLFWGRGILFPAISSSVYMWLYPPASRWIFTYWHTQEQLTKVRRDQIDKATPISEEEAQELRTKMVVKEAEFRTSLTSLSKENDDLKAQIVSKAKNELPVELRTVAENIQKSWAEFGIEIETMFAEVEKMGSDRANLVRYLSGTYNKWIHGQYYAQVERDAPWDFTFFAVDYEGAIVYHPNIAPDLRPSDPLVRQVIDLRNGTFLNLTHGRSEQLYNFFRGIPESNWRLSRIVCKDFRDFSAVVAVECHVNVIDRLPKIMKGADVPPILPRPR